MFVASQFAMTASSRLVTPKLAITGNQAIIVIRHGEDLDAWLKTLDAQTTYWKSIAPTWPKYEENPPIFNKFIPGTETHQSVTVQATVGHGLSPIGESQAKRLQEKLWGILASATAAQFGPLAPVTRAITINPSIPGATANTFDTIYPFLKNDPTFTGANNVKDKGKLLLIDNQSPKTSGYVADGFQAMLDTQSLLPAEAEGGGSTLLCWEGHALMGDSIKDPKSVLCQLAGATLTNMGACGTQITKGNVLYIFTKRDGSDPGTSDPKQDYNLDIYEVLANSPNEIGKLTWTYSYVVTRTGDFPTVTTTVLQYSKDLERSK
ncbi:MAG: hypothetical protein EBY29_15550 [Planctomycetes bacterium]|nr:hypothetical protein [Planctomycetota bacterium]